MTSKKYFAAVYFAAAFVFGTVASALVRGMISDGVRYYPIVPELSKIGFSDAARLVARLSSHSLVQTSLIFLAGYSVFATLVTSGVMLFRGAALGYTLSSVSRGSLVTGGAIDVFGYHIPSWTVTVFLYVMTTLAAATLGMRSARLSESWRREETVSALPHVRDFLVTVGACALFDVSKVFFIK